MPRLFDPYLLQASGALIYWERVAAANGQGDVAGTLPQVPQLHLRWMVSAAAGIAPEPFGVWVRLDQDKPAAVGAAPFFTDSYLAYLLPEPMLTVEVDATPADPAQPMMLSGYGGVPSADMLIAAESFTSAGPATLRIRAGGIWAFTLSNGSLSAVRGASVAAALAGQWELIEVAGLPVDATWAGSGYSAIAQGLTTALTDPGSAAGQRLSRGLAPLGWAPLTETGRPVPPWQAPNPASYVTQTQQSLLSQALPLFAPGVPPSAQAAIQPSFQITGPATAAGTAAGASQAAVPLQGVLLVAAATDPAAALALGFGTAYPLAGGPEVGQRDFMITARYPNGHLGDGTDEEYAAIVPWPVELHVAPGAPTGIAAERAGLLTPADPASPWRETIRLSFDRVPPSLALDRPVSASLAAYPAAPGPASLLVDQDPATGGYSTLTLAARPAPNQGQVALVDAQATELPLDLSARTLGHAVAVQDIFGLWSPWRDVSYTAGAPGYPIPQVVAARLDTSYAGSTTCPATFAADVLVDWQVRTPQTLELRAVLCPVPYPGADLPPGTGPYAAAPPGCVRQDLALSFSGDLLLPPQPLVGVEYLAADAQSTVDPAAPGFPANMHGDHGDARRYRVTVTGLTLDFAASPHYAVAVWAREQPTAAPALWGDVAAQPVVAGAGSPVPPVVSFAAPPAVPLGSMPDADTSSHVRVQTGGIAGAATVTLWSVTETALRAAAGLDPHPDRHLTLPDRYLGLQQAYDGLPASRRRAVFTRYATYDPSLAEVDVTLPRGSTQIHLFAVTAVNAAGVESAWPGSHAGLQAGAAPRLVRPTAPELSAAPHLGAGAVDITVSARCPLPITAFEIYATRVAAAAVDAGSMGPPLQVVPVAVPPADDGAPGGPLASVSVAPIAVTEDWRPLHLRAVAVPARVDDATGTYGARSAASPVACVTVVPSTAPDLSALTVNGWGPVDTGISVLFASAAPLAATPYGPHLLAVTARNAAAPADPPLFASRQPLPAISRDTGTPPAGAAAGVLVRGDRSAGSTPYGAWFTRPDLSVVLAIEVVLTDPLGRVSVRNYQVPDGLLDPPTVSIDNAQPVAGLLVVRFSTDAPASDSTGPYTLDVTAARRRVFPPFPPFPPPPVVLHARFSLPDIRAAGTGPPQPVDIDAVRDGSAGGITSYTVAARMAPPAVVTLTVTTPRGLTGTARATL